MKSKAAYEMILIKVCLIDNKGFVNSKISHKQCTSRGDNSWSVLEHCEVTFCTN